MSKSLRAKGRRLASMCGQVVLLVVVPVGLIVLWELAGAYGWINGSIMPRPSRIASTCAEMLLSGELGRHIGISLLRVVEGFAIGAASGIVVGILTGLFRRIDRALLLLLGLLRPIPILAWVPLLILWMGIDESSKVTIIALGSFWPVLLNTVHGIRHTDRRLLEVATIFRKSRPEVLRQVIFPSALPAIFTGLRLGVGIAWMCVVGAELIAAASGIGYLIMYARELSQPDVMFVGVFAIGLIGLVIDLALRRIERYLLRWNQTLEKS